MVLNFKNITLLQEHIAIHVMDYCKLEKLPLSGMELENPLWANTSTQEYKLASKARTDLWLLLPHGLDLCTVHNSTCHLWWLFSQGNLDELEQTETFLLESSVWKRWKKWLQKIWIGVIEYFYIHEMTEENLTILLVERFCHCVPGFGDASISLVFNVIHHT